MPISLEQLATYFAYIFIIVAYTIKVRKVVRMPLHLRWELYPVPHEKSYRYGGSYMEEPEWWNKPRPKNRARAAFLKIRDYFLLPGYFRRKKSYWLGLHPWHIGFYAIIIFHAMCFFGALLILTTGLDISGNSASFAGQAVYYVTLWLGVGSFILGATGSIILLVKRLADAELRAYASPLNYLNYVFFLLVFLSGLFAWYLFDSTLHEYRLFWQSLLAFKYFTVQPAVFAHIMLFSIFLIYLPFTRSTHYITKLISFFGILWDDTPNTGGKMEDRVKEYLKYPVSWSAPHIQSGKTWAESACGMPETKPK